VPKEPPAEPPRRCASRASRRTSCSSWTRTRTRTRSWARPSPAAPSSRRTRASQASHRSGCWGGRGGRAAGRVPAAHSRPQRRESLRRPRSGQWQDTPVAEVSPAGRGPHPRPRAPLTAAPAPPPPAADFVKGVVGSIMGRDYTVKVYASTTQLLYDVRRSAVGSPRELPDADKCHIGIGVISKTAFRETCYPEGHPRACPWPGERAVVSLRRARAGCSVRGWGAGTPRPRAPQRASSTRPFATWAQPRRPRPLPPARSRALLPQSGRLPRGKGPYTPGTPPPTPVPQRATPAPRTRTRAAWTSATTTSTPGSRS